MIRPNTATAMNMSPASTSLRAASRRTKSQGSDRGGAGGGSVVIASSGPRLGSRAARRDHRQQKIRRLVAAGTDGVGPGVVVGMIVHVAGAADAVARLHVEPDAVAFLEHHRGRPDLDLDPYDLAGRKIEPALVLVIGPIGQRQRGIELAMRNAQPAFRHRHRRALLTGLQHLVAVGIEVADGA